MHVRRAITMYIIQGSNLPKVPEPASSQLRFETGSSNSRAPLLTSRFYCFPNKPSNAWEGIETFVITNCILHTHTNTPHSTIQYSIYKAHV